MAFADSLAAFAALITRAAAEAIEDGTGKPPQSFPGGMSKIGAIDRFQGAVFKLKDGTFCYAETNGKCARNGSTEVELITTVGTASKRAFRKSLWLDGNVEAVGYRVLCGGQWAVGDTPTTLQLPEGSATEEHKFDTLLVCSGGAQPYPKPIVEALAMAANAMHGDDGQFYGVSPGGYG